MRHPITTTSWGDNQMSNLKYLTGLAMAAVFSMPTMASAADLYVAPQPALVAPAPAESPVDLLFGATLTTDYVSRGSSQSNGPALQGYVELDVWQLYASAWASNVDFTDPVLNDTSLETDLTFGWRPTLGPVSLDLGYVRYVYNGDVIDDYGEVFIKGSINPVKPLTLGAQFWINPEDTDAYYVEANAAYALPYDLKLSGAVGFVNAGSSDYWTGNVGLSWTYKDTITLDGRVWTAGSDCTDADGFSCGTKVVGSISVNSSLKKLGIIR
jgi:uncharacterized protein (TIGR02001 family)